MMLQQQPVDDTKQSLYYTPSMDTELQQQLLQEEPPPPQPLPVEPLTLFVQHLQELAEQQQQQAVAPEPEPVIPPPPLLDEKEQFYQRQQEILNQYKEFNNKSK